MTEAASRPPNPVVIFDALNAYQVSFALRAAIELDLFTSIDDGAATVGELARAMSASEKGARILSDFMAIHGFLAKHGDRYALTPVSQAFLSKRSPAYLGSSAFFLTHPMNVTNYLDLAGAVRKGGTAHEEGNMGPDAPVWVDFARWMAPMSAGGAAALAEIVDRPGQHMKVLDVAAGPGAYGIEIAKRNPNAQIYGQDWQNVLGVAVEHARQAGVADRYHTIPGNAFEVDLGRGYDLILLPNFLHHFDPPTIGGLLKKIRAALSPDGRVATVEFVPNDDRITPPTAASFGMMMLGATVGGDAYTFREYDAMFRDAGFGKSSVQPLPRSPETLILTEY